MKCNKCVYQITIDDIKKTLISGMNIDFINKNKNFDRLSYKEKQFFCQITGELLNDACRGKYDFYHPYVIGTYKLLK